MAITNDQVAALNKAGFRVTLYDTGWFTVAVFKVIWKGKEFGMKEQMLRMTAQSRKFHNYEQCMAYIVTMKMKNMDMDEIDLFFNKWQYSGS